VKTLKGLKMIEKNVQFLSAVCTSLSGPDAVKIIETPIRTLGVNEVLINVRAASLNFPDLLMTYGKYQYKPEIPFIVGMEGSGAVQSVGAEVQKFKVGDIVMFRGKTGACAEFKIANEDDVLPVPSNLSFEEAAAFGVTFQTAYVALVRRGRLQAGEWLLVHGAGGGVGQACVAVGKALGAKVIATASSAGKRGIALKSGADHVVDYHDGVFTQEIMSLTAGQGASVIMDPVGGHVLNESVNCLGWQGRLLSVGFASGGFGNINLEELRRRGGELIGVRAGEYGVKTLKRVEQLIVNC